MIPVFERHYDGAISGGKGRFHYNFNHTANPATGGAGYSRLVINGYDALGRASSHSQGFLANDGVTWKDYATSRTYDLASNILTQNYPSGRAVNYSYGASGRLSSASGNLGGSSYTYADTISYNAAGQMARERFGTTANLYHNLHYNNRLQLVDIRLGDSSSDEWNWSRGALVFYYGTTARDGWNAFANSTDNNGNVLRQINYVPLAGGYVIPQLDDYVYDGLNRITSITEAQQNSGGAWTFNVTSQAFTYDRWGNRLSVSGYNAQSWNATEASATNRLKLTSGTSCSGTKNGLCYDAAGNLIFDNQLGSAGDRTYDAEGRMTSAAGGGLNKYVYDADGKRVRRQVGAQQFWQVYGIGGELVAEYLWDGTTATLQKEYGYRSGEMLIVAEGATVRWLVTDHLGTPRMIADQTGSLSEMRRHDYLPFGEENFAGGTIRSAANGYQAEGVRQKFTGYERDAETSLDYAQARYYANLQGRFTSVDPLHASGLSTDPQSWNRYVYVGNRPTIVIDPNGLLWYRAKGSGSYGQPVWFDGDPGDGWEQIAPWNLVYYSANEGWVRLDPNRNRFSKGFASEEAARAGNTLDAAYAASDEFYFGFTNIPSNLRHQLGDYWDDPHRFAQDAEFTLGAIGFSPLSVVSGVAEEGVTLYRGVNESHIAFDAALNGVVKPNRRWWQLWKSSSSALEHNAGANGTLTSPFTSWTADPAVALNYALRGGGRGAVLEAVVPLSRTAASPNLYNVRLIQGGGTVSEAEILVRGVVTGAKVTKVP